MLGKLLRGGTPQPPPELPLVFRLTTERKLRLAQDYDPVNTWRFLSHHIRRYPQDLRAHTQRILLAQQDSLKERLPGTLQDAFIALGDAGSLLRGRWLGLVKNDLGEGEQAFFTHWLQQGFSAGNDHQWRAGSLLTTGQGSHPLRLVEVERDQTVAEYGNVLEEVFACLEYGQVDTARELLEAEAFAGRADEAMEQELVNIYQYTRDKERLDAMVKHLEETGRDISAVWKGTQQESEHW